MEENELRVNTISRIHSGLFINSKLSSLYMWTVKGITSVLLHFLIQQNWLLLSHLEWHVEVTSNLANFLGHFPLRVHFRASLKVCTFLLAWAFAWGWWRVMMTHWMRSSFTDFLNMYEINADLLSEVITCGNIYMGKPWYKAVFVEAEVFWEGSPNKQEILVLAK